MEDKRVAFAGTVIAKGEETFTIELSNVYGDSAKQSGQQIEVRHEDCAAQAPYVGVGRDVEGVLINEVPQFVTAIA